VLECFTGDETAYSFKICSLPIHKAKMQNVEWPKWSDWNNNPYDAGPQLTCYEHTNELTYQIPQIINWNTTNGEFKTNQERLVEFMKRITSISNEGYNTSQNKIINKQFYCKTL